MMRPAISPILGGFDGPIHISEEASNANVAVPWAIVSAIGSAGLLGFGKPPFSNMDL